jgi:hypothetical protein
MNSISEKPSAPTCQTTSKARVFKGQTGVKVLAVVRFSETSSRERAAYFLVRRFGGES